MIIAEKREKLKTGEILTVKVLMPPLEEYTAGVAALATDRLPWAPDTKKRINGELAADCKDLFFVGETETDLVSMMWYTVSGDVATYGMVFTRFECRNKGISSCLIKYCLEYMDREEDLLSVYLGVTNPIARKMYEKYGWVSYNDCPNTRIMRRLKNFGISQIDFDKKYYEYCGKATVRDTKRGDLPKFESLYNWTGNRWVIKDYPQNIFRNTAVESQIIALNNMAENQQGFFVCLENPKGRIVGSATLSLSSSSYQVHNQTLDFLIHPNYLNQGAELLRFILQKKNEKGNTWFYAASSDEEKVDLARRVGFKEEAVLKNYFNVEGRDIDLLIFKE